MDTRVEKLHHWLTNDCKLNSFSLHPLPGDASFRRYFRVFFQNHSFIVMDAPPPTENCLPFVAIAKALREHGLIVPDIFQADLDQGFLLLTDFGDRLLFKELTITNAHILYGEALASLAMIQTCNRVSDWTIPVFTAEFMRKELELFKEWFLIKHLNLKLSTAIEKMLDSSFDQLCTQISLQPYVFMHRDYHSMNLMVLKDNQIGILDFQDAFMGPITYDLVSLLRDCYIAWPEELVMQWLLAYQSSYIPSVNAEELIQWFDWMSLQRHLKALLTFSRKYRRDGNSNYLQHIPRTLNYILTVSKKYAEFIDLSKFLAKLACHSSEGGESICLRS